MFYKLILIILFNLMILNFSMELKFLTDFNWQIKVHDKSKDQQKKQKKEINNTKITQSSQFTRFSGLGGCLLEMGRMI